MRKKPFAFRISESEYNTLQSKAKRSKITMTEFLLRAIAEKEIVVVYGITELLSELKAIGITTRRALRTAKPSRPRLLMRLR